MDKNEMSDTPLVKKYIDSVDGMAHQSAIEIIINLEKKLETANTYADGYEAGYQAGMAEKKEWVGLTDDEIKGCIEATIEITDCLLLDAVNAVIIDVETMLRRKNI